jgi:anti-sigma factor RsiW
MRRPPATTTTRADSVLGVGMNSDCPQLTTAGAYVLGALEPAEMQAYTWHLALCRACRDEVFALAPVVRLLDVIAPPGPASLWPPSNRDAEGE